MLKLRARSRSFSNGGQDSHNARGENSLTSSKDDINIKPSTGNNNHNNTRVDFPVELARSLQSLAASFSVPSTSTSKNTFGKAAPPSRPLPPRPVPLKPILRSSISAEGQEASTSTTGTSSKHRASSSVSSAGSSKQISFLLPESPTRQGPPTTPQLRQTAAAHSRQYSASSAATVASTKSIRDSPTSSSSVATDKARRKVRKEPPAVPASVHCDSATAKADEDTIIHIKSVESMHKPRSHEAPEGRRCSTDSLSKELPPLPLNASAPASSASTSSRNSSRQSGHVRGESASSAASSVLSNPIHLPRLKLGDVSLSFPANLFSPSLDHPSSNRTEERVGFSPHDDKRFTWMGIGRKRDSSESKRSSKRRSDSSVVASLHSLPMNKHQRSRSSQLDVVHEGDPSDITLHAVPSNVQAHSKGGRPTFERNLTSSSSHEAARMTQMWVSLLEDFVLLCDDPSVPSSRRSSASSLSSSFVAPPSPSTSNFLLPPSAMDAPCPISPSPSSECDPFLRLPRSSRRAHPVASNAKPLPPSPMPSLEVDDSAGSTTHTQSPSTPAESDSPNLPSRASFNPFEASFSSVESGSSTAPETSISRTKRSSMPGNLAYPSNAYGATRPGKQRPPPLHLTSMTDSDDTIHTAVPPQTEAQTHFYTSQRSRSLPTANLEPGTNAYRQPISPSKRDLEAEQLGASTSSNGSNRASRRYHFPSSFGAPTAAAVNFLNSSTTSTTSTTSTSSRRRNKSIDEGYSGTGLTPTPTSDTFSIPSRSRETSISSTSEQHHRRSSSNTNTAETSVSSPSGSVDFKDLGGTTTPDKSNSLSRSQRSGGISSTASTPMAKRHSELKTRSQRSQSASEHVRKRSTEAGTMKRSPTLEIVMYGVAL